MTKHFTCFFLFVAFVFTGSAQSIDSTLSLYNSNFPFEKLHLHSDKERYLPGETIWFKAYILADGLPTTVSTSVYADLLDSRGKLIEHKSMPVLAATADSYFTLPDSSTETNYTIRAYTMWMLNFDTALIYRKTITVMNTSAASNTAVIPASLQFFAEGGNLVADLYNYVAFKATQHNGSPYDFTAAIKNSKNELIDSINSVHDGMGLLKFTPEANETYTAEWKDNTGTYRRTALPVAQTKGILLHAQQLNNELHYLINNTAVADNLQQLTLIATMNQVLLFKAQIKMNGAAANGKINTKEFPTGILQLTVLDKNNLPLTERIVFINNNDYSFSATVNTNEKSIAKRGKNKIEITVPDTVSTNLSVAVYDAGLEEEQSGRNIYTDLLLQGDLKGYVYNAGWYFNTNTPEAKDYLDLVMQTNGWRRYNWDKIIANQMPAFTYPRDNYLSIYGKADDNKKQGLVNQSINLIVQTKDSSKQWYLPVSNKEGIFIQSGLVFYDSATVFYKLNTANAANSVIVSPAYNGLADNTIIQNLPAFLRSAAVQAATTTNSYTQSFLNELKNKNPGFEKNAKLLNNITVRSGASRNWKNDPIVKMDEKYAGMYRGVGANSVQYDVLHDDMASGKSDVYNYMIGKAPGLTVKYDNGKYLVDYIRKMEPIIYLNESQIDNQMLATISIDDIAYIKYFSRAGWMLGFPPALCVYLKKGDDLKAGLKNLPSNLSKIKIAGYSPVKEFYSPNYSVADDRHANADLRTTLLWQPYVLTNKENKKATIVFYNNDISTRLKVVVEGMNEDGKLVYIEKIVE